MSKAYQDRQYVETGIRPNQQQLIELDDAALTPDQRRLLVAVNLASALFANRLIVYKANTLGVYYGEILTVDSLLTPETVWPHVEAMRDSQQQAEEDFLLLKARREQDQAEQQARIIEENRLLALAQAEEKARRNAERLDAPASSGTRRAKAVVNL